MDELVFVIFRFDNASTKQSAFDVEIELASRAVINEASTCFVTKIADATGIVQSGMVAVVEVINLRDNIEHFI